MRLSLASVLAVLAGLAGCDPPGPCHRTYTYWTFARETTPTDADLNAAVTRGDITILVGAGGTILRRTADGTYVQATSGTAEDLLSIGSFRSEDGLFAAGRRGTLLRGDDLGATWTPVALDTTADLHDILVYSTLGRVVVGDGVIFKSVDGGDVWTESAIPNGTGVLRDVDVFDIYSDHPVMYAVGDGGTVLTSDDLGRTWQRRPVGSTADLHWLSHVGIEYCSGDTCSDENAYVVAAGPTGGLVLATNGEFAPSPLDLPGETTELLDPRGEWWVGPDRIDERFKVSRERNPTPISTYKALDRDDDHHIHGVTAGLNVADRVDTDLFFGSRGFILRAHYAYHDKPKLLCF